MKKRKHLRLYGPQGQIPKREEVQVSSAELFSKNASSNTMQAVLELDKAVTLPPDPTEAQTKSAEANRAILKKVAIDFWAKGYVDLHNKAKMSLKKREEARVIVGALKDPKFRK